MLNTEVFRDGDFWQFWGSDYHIGYTVRQFDDGRKLRITVTGKNTGAISMAFQPENETTVDSEITADTLDKDRVHLLTLFLLLRISLPRCSLRQHRINTKIRIIQ